MDRSKSNEGRWRGGYRAKALCPMTLLLAGTAVVIVLLFSLLFHTTKVSYIFKGGRNFVHFSA